ncbi:MAG TPA: hypothetical protein VKU02_15675 [Gemmataceae bacterium]|nr:hypothetical protein [Gemmataceae bacterium]
MKRLSPVRFAFVVLIGLADPGTDAPAAPKQPGYKVYDHVVKATPPAMGEHKFRLVVPDGLAVVRGLLVVGPYSGGDSRDYHEQAWYREFLNLHGFAFLGASNYYMHDYQVMQAALEQFARDSKHPELVNAPYAVTGFSAGGGYTRLLMKADPDKVIAGVVVGSTMKLRGELTDDHRRVPMCVINGEREHDPGEGPGMAKQLEPVLAEHRPKGALWGWMAVPGVAHEFAGQEVLSMPMLDAAVKLRYPADADVRKGPVKLKPIDLESGWVADNTTWKSGLTAITPARQSKGDVAKSSWLLNDDVAFIYRAYSTLDWPLKISSPNNMSAKSEVFDAGSAVTIKVDDSKFAGWKKRELYDGATKVGELTEGKAEFTVKDLKAGYHAFSILGTDGKANTRTSNPVLVVARKLPGSAKDVPAPPAEPGVTILTTFPGDSGPGPKDAPDNSGAVGPDHVVDFTNANVVIHDKKSGKVVKRMTQTEFWKAANPGFDFPKLNDPRLLYDPLSKRWFGVIAEFKKLSVGYLAVSESSDPTKGWKAIKLPMEPTDPGMKLGMDKNGLYIGFYQLTGDSHTMMSVHAIPIADAVAADGPSLAHLQTFSRLEIECFPATDLNPNKAADAPAILLHHEFGNSFSKMFMYKITWAGNKASISKMQTIPLGKTYIIPNASGKNHAVQPAPGEKLRADEGRRTLCVYQHGDSLFTCNEAKRTLDSRCGIFWCQIRAKDGALLQEGLVDDPDSDYLVPSLAVDASGNVGLGCTRTSAKQYPSAYVMMHDANDPPNTMRPAVLGAKGTTVYSGSHESKYGLAWGNYNSTCVDPSDSAVLWTSQEYATSSTPGRWTTCWVAFKRK